MCEKHVNIWQIELFFFSKLKLFLSFSKTVKIHECTNYLYA